MKRIILISGLIAAVCLSSYGRKFVSSGDSHSPLGKYRIEVDDNYMMINGFQHKPYVISFENTDMEIRVAVTMEKGCRKYYVLSDNLSLQYVSNRHYFGVQLLDKDLEKDGFRTSTASLNRSEYFHQKAITGGEKWRRDKTPLIAVFYPQLISNTDEILAKR